MNSSIRALLRTILSTTIIAHADASAAACPVSANLQPARLIDSEKQREVVRNLAPEWESDESARIIRFGAYVGENGQLYDFCCFSSSRELSLARRRMWANRIRALRFTPASRNGEDVRVYVGFTVIARKIEGGTDATLLLNSLISADDFGARYIAPQRIATRQIYGEPMWISDVRINSAVLGEITVDVDSDGNTSNSRISRWEKGSSRYQNRIVEKMDVQCFIPGMVDGAAVEMPYSEVFQYQ